MRDLMTEAIHRFEVPVDDSWHTLSLSGPVVHVAARESGVVSVWAISGRQEVSTHRVRVYGTGHHMPDGLTHRGTALVSGLVWHLMEEEQ